MNIKNQKVGMVSLGCPKALVDSERILTTLTSEGYDIVGDYDGADLVIVNTCGFIDSAKAESLQAINEALSENGKVIVTGCLSKADQQLQEKFPELLSISGPQQYDTVVKAVRQHLPNSQTVQNSNLYPNLPASGIKLTPRHYAYLKVSEGCNHKCTFCIIPSLRGKLDSRRIDQVLQEAEALKNDGVKELLIVAQDTSAYGLDIKYEQAIWNGKTIKTQFQTLCEELSQLGIWVRLHYVYPYPHVDKIIPLMNEGSLLPYLDIPFQHSHPDILKAMKRPASSENVLKRVQTWREICPDINLRSTFIVGFPGETEQHFQHLLEFLHEAKLDRAGCFKYSKVDGAVSNKLHNHVDEEIKEQRWHDFMETQTKISRQQLAKKVGKKESIIIDESSPFECFGRSRGDAPDIDGRVIIQGSNTFKPGDIIEAKITNSDDFDLFVDLNSKSTDKISLENL
jgi:ribosomal protein S12 methylthiotransferase